MGKLTHIAGVHFSHDPEGDHVFLQVATMDGQSIMNSTILRFKGTGFYNQPPEGSKATEAVIYTPINEMQARALRDLSVFLLQLDGLKDSPLVYHSGNGNNTVAETARMLKEGMDINGKGNQDADFVYMNCMGMVILGCALAGIDVEKLIQHEELSATESRTKGIISAAYDNNADVLERSEQYIYCLSPDDDPTPRAILIDNTSRQNLRGPKEALNALVQQPVLMAKLQEAPTTILKPRVLPAPIQKAAKLAGIVIPETLRR